MNKRSIRSIAAVMIVLVATVWTTAATAEPGPAGTPGVKDAVEDPMQFVTVNWWEELVDGGVTMVFLGLLSVLMVAFAVERLIVLRNRRSHREN